MRPITKELAQWALATDWESLPDRIRVEAGRAFLNWFGCALGGSGEALVDGALAATALTGGAAQASILGRGVRSDVVSAAFLNCLSASALAYDDTHLATVTHPTGPVAAPLLAHAETVPTGGRDLLAALAVGIEIQCRMSNVLLMPPATANLSLYITGVTGPIGAAAALGRLMGFDEARMRWALGHAATQGAGFRATHGAMSGLLVPAFGARAGYFAAQLAAHGVECRDDVLEAPKGFVEIYSTGADLGHATRGLGDTWEVLANAYKPYPAGIVVHPVIDACRDVLAQMGAGDRAAAVRLHVHPLTIGLGDRRHPATMFEAMVSLQHCAACVFARGTFGVGELRQEAIDSPVVAALRDRVTGIADDSLARDQARAEVTLADGRVLSAFVEHARGSIARPMTDAELDEKFLAQAEMVLDDAKARRLLETIRSVADALDAGATLRRALEA